jgi:hypothetical protein
MKLDKRDKKQRLNNKEKEMRSSKEDSWRPKENRK